MNIYRIMTDSEIKNVVDTNRATIVFPGNTTRNAVQRAKAVYVGASREIRRRMRRGEWALYTGEVLVGKDKFETPYIQYPYMTLWKNKHRLHPDEATAKKYVKDRKNVAGSYYGGVIKAWEWDDAKDVWKSVDLSK